MKPNPGSTSGQLDPKLQTDAIYSMANKKQPPMHKPPAPESADSQSKFRQDGEAAKFSDKLRRSPLPPTSGQLDPKLKSKGIAEKAKTENPDAKENKKLEKSKLRAEKSGRKLDSAREKLNAQKSPKPLGAGKLLATAASAEVAAQVHRKIREVERDNVGVEAAHETELLGERARRAASRHAKHRARTRNARRVRKLEKLNVRRNADYHYRQTVKENPAMKKNAAKRYLHKKRVQRQFAKKAKKEARKTTGGAAVKTVAVIGGRLKLLLIAVAKKPKVMLAIGLCLLLVTVIQSCVSMGMSFFSTSGGGILATTYLSEDADMLAAEAQYAAMGATLQNMLDNYETHNPGYDEYIFELDEIWHDPYALISILSALHDGPWTVGGVQGILAMLFDMQYTLTETVTVEVRYRTETRTGTGTEIRYDEDGEPYTFTYTYTYTVEVPYDYYIMTVRLENYVLSRLPIHVMNEERLSRYALYMRTLGNRPDLFEGNPFANRGEYLRYEIPPEALKDEVFRRMITEAEKYLGWPYVWGGSSPATSFDCSGFVSWVINNSGWNMGRLTSQGLFNSSTPISPADAKPGDLIFFTGTYASPGPVSHVGIYVGGGMMIHCGSPISYVSIHTPYWTRHFYSFARLP